MYSIDSLIKRPGKPIRWPTDRNWESWGVSPASISPMITAAIANKKLDFAEDSSFYEIKGSINQISDRLSKPGSTESIEAVPQDLEESKPSEGKHGIEISAIEAYMPRRCPGLRGIIKETISALEIDGEKNPIEYIMIMVLHWRRSANGKRGEFAMHPRTFMDWIVVYRNRSPMVFDIEHNPIFS